MLFPIYAATSLTCALHAHARTHVPTHDAHSCMIPAWFKLCGGYSGVCRGMAGMTDAEIAALIDSCQSVITSAQPKPSGMSAAPAAHATPIGMSAAHAADATPSASDVLMQAPASPQEEPPKGIEPPWKMAKKMPTSTPPPSDMGKNRAPPWKMPAQQAHAAYSPLPPIAKDAQCGPKPPGPPPIAVEATGDKGKGKRARLAEPVEETGDKGKGKSTEEPVDSSAEEPVDAIVPRPEDAPPAPGPPPITPRPPMGPPPPKLLAAARPPAAGPTPAKPAPKTTAGPTPVKPHMPPKEKWKERPAHISGERMQALTKLGIPLPPKPKAPIGMSAAPAADATPAAPAAAAPAAPAAAAPAAPAAAAPAAAAKPPHGPRGQSENSHWHTAWFRAKAEGPAAVALFLRVFPKPKARYAPPKGKGG